MTANLISKQIKIILEKLKANLYDALMLNKNFHKKQKQSKTPVHSINSNYVTSTNDGKVVCFNLAPTFKSILQKT